MIYRSYDNVDLSIYSKPKKRKLELFNQRFIKEKGGIFALTGTEIDSHHITYRHILRERSPLSIFEVDPKTAWIILERILYIRDKRLHLYPCDIRNIFYTSPKPKGKKYGAYRYGHLDFCVTGRVLVREGLLDFFEKLARWNNLYSPFYLETTFSVWGDGKFKTGENVGLNTLEKYIPTIFEQHGWKVNSPRNRAINKDPQEMCNVIARHWCYTVSYEDGCPMINGFHKFTRR